MKKCFFLVTFLLIFPYTVLAKLELKIIRPIDEFITNNNKLIIEGFASYEEGQTVTVTITTPAGVPELSDIKYTLHSIVFDIGSKLQLSSLVFTPIFKDSLSYSPRVVKIFSSSDGQDYKEEGTFYCSYGIGQDHGESHTDFGKPISSRFIRIDMIDGWQADKISIKDVSFIDVSGNIIHPKIRGVSFGFDENDIKKSESGLRAHFIFTALLRDGENQLSISARAENIKTPSKGIEEDFTLAKVTYLSEVSIPEESLVLSDGYKAKVKIPYGAIDSNIKKIGISPINLDEIQWKSYAENRDIVRGTSPVLAYKFDIGAETPFFATAKSSLDRQLPNLVVDGKTDYPSTWMTAFSALPVWLKVDLLSNHTIGKVIIYARIKDKISYGPRKISISVSSDDKTYEEITRVDECNDSKTEIILPVTPFARYVKFDIEEGKQGNNIQINEVEFYDAEGTKIIAYRQLNSLVLTRTAQLTMSYNDADLSFAGVHSEKNLAIFSWDNIGQEWRLVGGMVNEAKNTISVNLNYFTSFAIFEANKSKTDVQWSHNPFSPNGDGIADTTTIYINLGYKADIQAKVEIFDYTGKLVRTLIQEDTQSGNISILWDGKDENGDRVEIGAYIYQVSIGKEIRNGTLIVAR